MCMGHKLCFQLSSCNCFDMSGTFDYNNDNIFIHQLLYPWWSGCEHSLQQKITCNSAKKWFIVVQWTSCWNNGMLWKFVVMFPDICCSLVCCLEFLVWYRCAWLCVVVIWWWAILSTRLSSNKHFSGYSPRTWRTNSVWHSVAMLKLR